MSNVYKDKPNVVKITVEDLESTEFRYVTGLTHAEIVEALELSLDGVERKDIAPEKKQKRHRRTKAELQKNEPKNEAETPAETKEVTEKEKAWA